MEASLAPVENIPAAVDATSSSAGVNAVGLNTASSTFSAAKKKRGALLVLENRGLPWWQEGDRESGDKDSDC